MIHNAWGGMMGEAEDMRKTANLLEKLSNESALVYSRKTGLPVEDIKEMMDEETWLNASEALELGFIDTITDAVKVAAKYDLSKFKNISNEEVSKQLNINQKSTKMTEELKSWFSAQVETIVNAVKGEAEVNTEVSEINVNLMDNEEIKNKLSEFENKGTELEASISEKDSEIAELNETISNLTTEKEELTSKNVELNTLVNKADATGTKVETDKDPAIVNNKVEDANSGFYNMIAGMIKNRVSN